MQRDDPSSLAARHWWALRKVPASSTFGATARSFSVVIADAAVANVLIKHRQLSTIEYQRSEVCTPSFQGQASNMNGSF